MVSVEQSEGWEAEDDKDVTEAALFLAGRSLGPCEEGQPDTVELAAFHAKVHGVAAQCCQLGALVGTVGAACYQMGLGWVRTEGQGLEEAEQNDGNKEHRLPAAEMQLCVAKPAAEMLLRVASKPAAAASSQEGHC